MSHARGSASIINQRGNWRATPAPPPCLSFPAIGRAQRPALAYLARVPPPILGMLGQSFWRSSTRCSLSWAKCREQSWATAPHPTHEMNPSLELPEMPRLWS